MNNCAEIQTRACKAYISDCYGRLADAHNKCNSAERSILRKNIFDMLDRVKALLSNDVTDATTEQTEPPTE